MTDTSDNTDTDRATVTVHAVKNIDEIHCRYPRETSPQPVFVTLDQRHGDLRLEYDPEIGGGVPSAVRQGQVLRWGIPPLTLGAANWLLRAIKPLAERVLDGAVEEGYGWEATYTRDAEAALAEIRVLCDLPDAS